MKTLLLAICLLLLNINFALAQVVTAEGSGEDRDAALNDAKRNAVEQVVGLYLDSQTLVSQNTVVEDTIFSQAYGFVTDFQILDEKRQGEIVTVQARIDVNTNPDSQLMNKIQLLQSLGDPRIGVIVFKNPDTRYTPSTTDSTDGYYNRTPSSESVAGEKSFDDLSEQAINQKLLEMGFNHIADVNVIARLRNTPLLAGLYNDGPTAYEPRGELGVDILVLADSSTDVSNITIPQYDYSKPESVYAKADSGMLRAGTVLTGKIILLGTGYIKATFKEEGAGIGISPASARNKAVEQAAGKVADAVEKALRTQAAKVFKGITINASSDDPEKIAELVKQLKNLPGVQSVYLREQKAGKAVIEVESNQKPHVIYRLLKEKSGLGLFSEDFTAQTMDLFVS